MTISSDAYELKVRVVEMESLVSFSSGSSVEKCFVKKAEGCTFNVPEKAPVHLKISGPNGIGFQTLVSILEPSNATLFVHLTAKQHYFVLDSQAKVGDLLNTRLLSGMIIPQSSGKLREKVYFTDKVKNF